MVGRKIQEDLCNRIIKLNKGIRYVGLVNRSGKIVVGKYRKGLTPLLSKTEEESHVKQSVRRIKTVQAINTLFHERKLGKIIYSYILFENVKRATIPIRNHVLLLSFDKDVNHETIIMKKVLPYVRKREL